MNNLSLGVAVSALQEKLADTSAWTVAANLGGIYSFTQHPLDATYKVGMSALNLGPGLKFVSERAPLPEKLKFGGSVEHIKSWPLNLTLDVTKPNDNSTYVSFGSEYWFKEILALRLGYVGSNDTGKGLRLGVGLKIRQFLLDYAYGSSGDFGAIQRIQLALQWGERVKQMNTEQRKVLKDAKRSGEAGDYTEQIAQLDGLLQEDPTNTRLLKQMIAAHDKMLAGELKEAVASIRSRRMIFLIRKKWRSRNWCRARRKWRRAARRLILWAWTICRMSTTSCPRNRRRLVEPPTPGPRGPAGIHLTPRVSQPVPSSTLAVRRQDKAITA